MTPTDILGNIKLYNADCIEVMKTFKDKQFSLAIIDPPYGIDIANIDIAETETSIEINFAVLKFKHSVKRKSGKDEVHEPEPIYIKLKD